VGWCVCNTNSISSLVTVTCTCISTADLDIVTVTGQFCAGEMHGTGTLQLASGAVYEGQMCHNKYQGASPSLAWAAATHHTCSMCRPATTPVVALLPPPVPPLLRRPPGAGMRHAAVGTHGLEISWPAPHQQPPC
jgi:hypothetical protein